MSLDNIAGQSNDTFHIGYLAVGSRMENNHIIMPQIGQIFDSATYNQRSIAQRWLHTPPTNQHDTQPCTIKYQEHHQPCRCR